MIRKTEAIVLNTRKFGDSSLITSMYTRVYGRQNYLIKGYRSTRAKKRHSYFQPMSVIEVVFYHKDNRDLQLITESTNRYFFQSLQTNPIKITLGMVVMEVFYQSVREEERNDQLFDFLKSILIEFDRRDAQLIHIFLFFMVRLTRFLGFEPRNDVRDTDMPVYFDLRGGILENAHGARTSDYLVAYLRQADLENCTGLRFSNEDKSELISTLLQYYMLHVEGFREPESLKVLQEVFG
ncbi:MAG: DNA repair protein RecO [Bacteroidota bacterium]